MNDLNNFHSSGATNLFTAQENPFLENFQEI